ncbi:hypothetical protein D7N80_23445 [Salmonella enterica subsp. enterica]|uniref:Uncharacterized protein n=1 Tax=Salmonella enterica I TaxID=59201 RepID=A0A403QMR1_SALET|nr:hypothetical protein [Salmonella enterica subsp. enterica serovar Kidderminster]
MPKMILQKINFISGESVSIMTMQTISYIEFWTLIYYIDHCSFMAISIEFLISVSEETKTNSPPFYNYKNNQRNHKTCIRNPQK